jgi:hypothetical protein
MPTAYETDFYGWTHLPARDPRAGWVESVDIHRIAARDLMADNPGLVPRLDMDKIYGDARRVAGSSLLERDGLARSVLRVVCPFTRSQILDADWYG